MALILSTARANLRARLRELTASAWLDAELNTWLNEGAQDIAARTECLMDSDTAAVTASVRTVTPPSDVLRIHRIQFEPTADTRVFPLRYKDFHAMDKQWGYQNGGTGYPEFWTSWGLAPAMTLYLEPVPVVAGNLRIQYYRSATTAASDGASLDVLDGWAHYVYDYAEYRAFLRNGDGRFQQALAKHEQNLVQIMDLTRRGSDQPGEWVDEWPSLGGDGGPWFNNMGFTGW